MQRQRNYPRLVCDLAGLRANVAQVTERCRAAGIQVTGVIKGVNALLPLVTAFLEGGCSQLATSRLSQVEDCRSAGVDAPFLLLRVPQLCELADVVRLCQMSLESDVTTLDALEAECARQGREHSVLLMADLGDLREGFWGAEELVQAAVHVEKALPHLHLAGVGTNLGCYGSIRPTRAKLEELAELAEQVERAIGRRLELVSGGATTSYPLVVDGQMPERVNHLRIGENILLGYDLRHEWGRTDLDYLNGQVFTLQAQVVEVRSKPSYPQGEIFIDAFGNRPEYEDRGIRRRALLALGKLDVGELSHLHPRLPGVTVLGGSSDHTILDVEDCPRPIQVGDVLEFDLSYSALLYLTAARDVSIDYHADSFSI